MHILALVSAYLVFIKGIHAAFNINAPKTDLFNLASFAFTEKLDAAGCHTLYWTLLNPGKKDESLKMAMVMNVSRIKESRLSSGAWMAIGFGDSMMMADMVIATSAIPRLQQEPTLAEYIPTGSYEPPMKNPNPTMIRPLSVKQNGSVFVAVFQRSTDSLDSTHNQLKSRPFDLIWAFNPTPPSSSPFGWAFWHGDNRGSVSINLATGQVGDPLHVVSLINKRAHGLVMAMAWMIFIPLGIFLSRYCRSRMHWMNIHIGIQSISSLLVFIMLIVISETLPASEISLPKNSYLEQHHNLGYAIASFLSTQIVLGVLNRARLQGRWNHVLDTTRPIVKFAHNWTGRLLIIMGFIQVGLGIELLYPVSEIAERGKEAWAFYGVFLCLWFLAFTVAEFYYKTHWVRRGGTLKAVVMNGMRWIQSDAKISPQDQLQVVSDSVQDKAQQIFTWADLDESIRQNKIYVVANGKYVFDAGSWLSHHPGGQTILKAVAGTDITNDYFHEAGYDAQVFIPVVHSPTSQLRKRAVKPSQQERHVTEAHLDIPVPPRRKSSFHHAPPEYTRPPPTSLPLLTDQEQKLLHRARRCHTHSELALAKLAKFCIGEIEKGQGQFDPLEYRRYGIVAKTLVSAGMSSTPVYRFKFCLLYPYTDTRMNEPDHFLPGQCVEIIQQIGQTHLSRYYTPIGGTTTSFDIDIKCRPGGRMGDFWRNMRCGERQIKIRGPFGRVLVDIERPLHLEPSFPSNLSSPSSKWCFDKMVFIVAGSGMTPVNQLLQYLFLSEFKPLYVHQPYTASNDDEIDLRVGDFVVISRHLLDGWAEGTNLLTGAHGVLPLPCTLPLSGSLPDGKPRVTVLNCVHSVNDIFSLDYLEGVVCAYPDHIDLVHYISGSNRAPFKALNRSSIEKEWHEHGKSGKKSILASLQVAKEKKEDVELPPLDPDTSMIPGQLVYQKLNAGILKDTLTRRSVLPSHEHDNDLLIVCGPDAFNGNMYDTLVGPCLVPHHHVTILPTNQF